MKRAQHLFQLQFNLLSLLLVIGLVAFISDRATLHNAQKIDRAQKAGGTGRPFEGEAP